MPAPVRTAVAVLAIAVLALAVGCHAETPQQERVSLCTDLVALHVTVVFLRDPPSGALVGEVRGDLDKLDPTVQRAQGSDVADDAIAEQLADAQEAYRTLLGGIGDDDRFSTVVTGSEGEDLWGAYQALTEQLGCGDSLVAGG